MGNCYSVNNISLGVTLEEACKMVLSSNGYHVEDHKVTDSGVDVNAYLPSNEGKVIECLNWWGGYIHPKRFRSIVDNLSDINVVKKYLICFGVKPTKQQYRLLRGYGIKVIHYYEQIKAITKDVLKFLAKELRCYYYSVYSIIYNNSISFLTLLKEFNKVISNLSFGKSRFRLSNLSKMTGKSKDSRQVKNRIRNETVVDQVQKDLKEVL